MLFFGHVGLTLGAAAAADYAYSSARKPYGVTQKGASGIRARRLSIVPEHVDLRILLAGSLLPDAIDKPLGIYILGNAIGNGRIFSHTLIFLLLVCVVGAMVFWRWRRTWGLVLAFGTFTHLVLDTMWNRPQTLFWPFLGTAFPKQDTADWIEGVVHNLLTEPSFYVPEIAGAIILLGFLVIVLKKKSPGALITKGKVL